MDKVDHRNITITNDLDFDIYCLSSNNDSLNEYIRFIGYLTMESSYLVRHGSSSKLFTRPRFWDSYVASSDSGKMRLFIIPVDSVTKYGWEYAFEKDLSIQKLKLDINDLISAKWNIVIK